MCLKSSCKVNKLETRQRESSLKVAKLSAEICNKLAQFSSLFTSQSFVPDADYPNPFTQLRKISAKFNANAHILDFKLLLQSYFSFHSTSNVSGSSWWHHLHVLQSVKHISFEGSTHKQGLVLQKTFLEIVMQKTIICTDGISWILSIQH